MTSIERYWMRQREGWRENREIVVGKRFAARFETYYEDKRDVMCDSPVPEWGVSERRKNRRVSVFDGDGRVVFRVEVERDAGNEMYRELVRWSDWARRWCREGEDAVEEWLAGRDGVLAMLMGGGAPRD